MTPTTRLISRQHVSGDLVAGIVVFVVALPLCLGIALGSGAPLFAGVIAGVVGGVLVTLISRSALGVSGPAAGLTVIVAEAISRLGFETFLLAVVVAGALQVIAGFLRGGIISYYFPSSVIRGMLAGIGIIMVLKQIPYAFGYAATYEGSLQFVEGDGGNSLSELSITLFNVSPGAVLIALLSLVILIAWETPVVQRHARLRLMPAPLLVVVFGVAVNSLYGHFLPILEQTGDELVNLPVAATFSDLRSFLTLPDFSQWASSAVYVTAFTLAVVASLETLLSVEAVDKIDRHKRVTPTDLELKAQGVGNIVSGLLGGLPLTQVIVRSAANVQAGGQTRFSSLVHGVLLLLTVALIPRVLNQIPLACLAAILILIGYKLAKVSLFRSMYRLGWWQFAPFMVTVAALVFTDMLTGLLLGMAVGVFCILLAHYRTDFMREHAEGTKYRLTLSEHMSFLNKASVIRKLQALPPGTDVTIDGSRCQLLDHDVREVIRDFVEEAPQKNITVHVRGIDGIRVLGAKSAPQP